ncbi:MAG: hypothetical protein LJE59_09185 [Chromatiaceae bacterium]|nr:hypothetical protein [Chromatiaceae bacterium]
MQLVDLSPQRAVLLAQQQFVTRACTAPGQLALDGLGLQYGADMDEGLARTGGMGSSVLQGRLGVGGRAPW